MTVQMRIGAMLIGSALPLVAIGAAFAGGPVFTVGPVFSPKLNAALGTALTVRSEGASAVEGAAGDFGGARRALGCIDIRRFPDFVNVPPTSCVDGRWPGS